MRYLFLVLLMACGTPPAIGGGDAGPCVDPTPAGSTIVGPSGTSQPASCLDGKTGAWIALRYASDYRVGMEFDSVGATVSLGNDVNGTFTAVRDFTSDRQTPNSSAVPQNIWIDLSGQEGVSEYQIFVWGSLGGMSYSGHNLPVKALTDGHVEHFDIQLEKH